MHGFAMLPWSEAVTREGLGWLIFTRIITHVAFDAHSIPVYNSAPFSFFYFLWVVGLLFGWFFFSTPAAP